MLKVVNSQGPYGFQLLVYGITISKGHKAIRMGLCLYWQLKNRMTWRQASEKSWKRCQQPWRLGVQDDNTLCQQQGGVEEHKDRLCDKLCPTWTQWPVAAAAGQEDTQPSKEGRECGPLQGPNRQNPKHTGAKLLGKVNPTPNTGPQPWH